MPPQITCPHCGNTINLENRKEVDFEKITYALNNSSKTFTELLEITNLPRKTLSLRLKDLCNSGSIVKDGGYRLSTSFRPYKKISGTKRNGNGKMKGTMLRMGRNVQWIPVALIACLVIVAFGSAMLVSPPAPSPAAPTASFFYEPSLNLVTGKNLTFDAALSRASNGPIASYYWDFGDGSPSAYGQIVTHVYVAEGTYTVTLTVKDAHGLTTGIQETVDVSPTPKPAMVIKFTVSPDPTIVDSGWENEWIISKPLTFDASAFNASTGFAPNYSWDFGDGVTGSGVMVSHAYTENGTYGVTLSVTDLKGAVQLITQQVRILPMPTTRIFVTSMPTHYQINDTITLNIMISNVTDLWAWQAGMTFNPTVLQCITELAPVNAPPNPNAKTTALVEGDFLRQNGGATIWFPGTADDGVIIPHGDTLTSPAAPVSGSGVLATVKFKVIGQGAFDVQLANVKLIGQDGVTQIPVFVAT